jgi:hypothetical protein
MSRKTSHPNGGFRKMNESSKTIAFVSVAVLMVGLAVASHFVNRPKIQQDFELVGQPFYEDFTSSEQAEALEVAAVDTEDVSRQQFSVKKADGLWRIPSHHNYPAEAAVRLAETATSVMGIERESLAGRLASDHEKLGVIDPLSDDIEDPEAVGKRITLKDGDGEVLVDYIIGNEAGDVVVSDTERRLNEGGIPEKYFYVRRPDEQQTYKVKLDVDLSTRFSDWIDPDLLRLDRNKLVRILIDNYSLEEERSNPLGQVKSLFKEQGDQLELTRKSNSDPWVLTDLNAETEELQSTSINGIIDVLSGIRIAGVRPKFKYQDHLLLTSDLQLNRQPEFEQNPQEFARAISQLQTELEDKGFNLAGSSEKLELASQQGQLDVGTNDGVLYSLQVGKEVLGEEKAIEIGEGNEANGTQQPTDSNDEEPAEPSQQNAQSSEDEVESEGESNEAKNRYLMIRVSFDENLLGERLVKPTEPTKPTEPEGYSPPPVPEEGAEQPDTNEENYEGDDAVEAPDAKPERKPEFVKYDLELAEFEQQKVDYELAVTKFEQDVKVFEKKVEKGQKLVEELNERFADWYYVITAENLKTLQTSRLDLITVKESSEGEPSEGEPGEQDSSPALPTQPDISFPASELDQEAGDVPDTSPEKAG